MKQFCCILSTFLFAATLAQAQNLEEVLKKYYDAAGADAWKNKTTMTITGLTSSMGGEFPVTIYSMRPNLQKAVIEMSGKEVVESFDGETAWSIIPWMNGPSMKTDEESREAAKQMFEDDLIDYKAKGHTATLEGIEEVNGAPAYKIKLARKSGDEVTYFIDRKSHLPVMRRTFAGAGELKGQAIDMYFSNYSRVEGVMIPFAMEQKLGERTFIIMKITKVEFNQPMASEFFRTPGK